MASGAEHADRPISDMSGWLILVLIFLAAVIALFALDWLLLRMEAKGWIYWRNGKPKGGGVAAGLSAMHQLVEPDVRYVIEDRAQRRTADPSEQGGPPAP